MDHATDELMQRIVAALAEASEERVARIIDEAEAEADAEVKETIKSARKAVLLRRAASALEGRAKADPSGTVPGTSGDTLETSPYNGSSSHRASSSAPASAERAHTAEHDGKLSFQRRTAERHDSAKEEAERAHFAGEEAPGPAADPSERTAGRGWSAERSSSAEAVATEAKPAGAETGASAWFCYVFGVTEAEPHHIPDALEGMTAGRPAQVLEHGGLRAIICPVRADQFDQAALGEQGRDASWLRERVLVHDEVLRRVMEAGTVLPFRFGTAFRDERGIRDWLGRHHDRLRELLRGLRDRQEWGVKIFRDADQLMSLARDADGAGSEFEAELSAASEGKAYFLEKQRDARAQREAERIGRLSAQQCHHRLAALADRVAPLKSNSASVPQDAGRMILNASYLVPGDAVAGFHQLVDQLHEEYRPRGLMLEINGPWPPYSFADLDLTEADEDG